MRKAERCGWMRKEKRSSGLAERSGGSAGRSGGLAERRGLAGRSGGLAERQRRRSFVEQQSFWVFPLHALAVHDDVQRYSTVPGPFPVIYFAKAIITSL